ncbi:MAG: M18 family aminopeptidase [Clostridia bacterium]|nr:M18 family aminopeptidase [Clostridia bacterium]
MPNLSQDILKSAKGLAEFIDCSPTSYHAVSQTEKILREKGAIKLSYTDSWDIKADILYYVIHENAICAFSANPENVRSGFNIAAAHTDSPGFRIKPCGSKLDSGYERLSVESYGGTILHTWLDRPLALAGRIYVDAAGTQKAVDIDTKKPCVIIPSAAIHIVRDVNESAKFNIQNELSPILMLCSSGEKKFTHFIAGIAGIKEEDILSFDLMPYEAQKTCFVGANDEFISAGRIDDLAMVYSIFSSLPGDSAAKEAASKRCFAAFAFDNEECGSKTASGASSRFAAAVLERVCESFGLTHGETVAALAESVILSADMAHAVHPAYPGKSDPDMQIKMNGGPVLKTSSNQSYSSSPKGCAFFKKLCKDADVPCQLFANHSDMRSGSTIGPILATEFSALSVDIGAAMLSMHSVRELCGSKDPYYMRELFKKFFSA